MSIEMEILDLLYEHIESAKTMKERRQAEGGSMLAYEAAFWATRESGYRMILDDIRDIIDKHAHEEYGK